MSFASDLLAQSRHLLTVERRRPKQASLRRAISAAYYALFHLLTEESAQRLVSGTSWKKLRQQTERAFDHGTMRQCCKAFSGGALPASVAPLLAGRPSPSLQQVANAFTLLQEARHDADYDTSLFYTRPQADAFVQRAEAALTVWNSIRATDEARVFLVSLLLWRQWNRT